MKHEKVIVYSHCILEYALLCIDSILSRVYYERVIILTKSFSINFFQLIIKLLHFYDELSRAKIVSTAEYPIR